MISLHFPYILCRDDQTGTDKTGVRLRQRKINTWPKTVRYRNLINTTRSSALAYWSLIPQNHFCIVHQSNSLLVSENRTRQPRSNYKTYWNTITTVNSQRSNVLNNYVYVSRYGRMYAHMYMTFNLVTFHTCQKCWTAMLWLALPFPLVRTWPWDRTDNSLSWVMQPKRTMFWWTVD